MREKLDSEPHGFAMTFNRCKPTVLNDSDNYAEATWHVLSDTLNGLW